MPDRLYRVVCTRRLDDHWVAQALAQHIILESLDFLDIKLKDPELFREVVEQNEAPFVFTSSHAVYALKAYKAQYADSLKTEACFCIDGSTKAAAQEAGFSILNSGKDARSLAQPIIDAGIKHVLHCGVADRRKELEQILTDAGVQYDFCAVYEKAPAPKSVGNFDGVIFYSPSQVDAFMQQNTLAKNTPAFCIGETTARHLKAMGHDKVYTGSEARTEHILQTVFQYFNQQ